MNSHPFSFVVLGDEPGATLGMCVGLTAAGGRGLLTTEANRFARGSVTAALQIPVASDVRELNLDEIPGPDVLAATLPGAPFSAAGKAKRRELDRPEGTDDEEAGAFVKRVLEVIEAKLPKAVLLEMVTGVLHTGGEMWKAMRARLEALGYTVSEQGIDAVGFVPQGRKRFYAVGLRGDRGLSLEVTPRVERRALRDILDPILDPEAKERYTLSDKMMKALERHAERHKVKGHGFGLSRPR